MSIEKKSLISTLKTTKKANAVSSDSAIKPATVSTKRVRRAYRALRAQPSHLKRK
jgi:hypothetical protein